MKIIHFYGKIRKMLTVSVITSLFLVVFTELNAQQNRYVRAGATGTGTSWTDASGSIQAMIDELGALTGGGTVHVAAGTYTPTRQALPGYAIGYVITDRDKSFVLLSNVFLIGGYTASGGARTFDANGMPTNATILSGAATNSYHVVYSNGVTNVSLDGFHITGGRGGNGYHITGGPVQQRGYGMYLFAHGSQPITIKNTQIYGNEEQANSYGYGGAICYQTESTSYAEHQFRLENVVIRNNRAHNGGGIYFAAGGSSTLNIKMTKVTIKDNVAGSSGGGINLSGKVREFTTNQVNVFGNQAGFTGGGLALAGNDLGNCNFTNMLIHSNTLTGTGGYGGGVFVTSGNYTFTNVTITNNSGRGVDGEGMYISAAATNLNIRNSIIWNANAGTTFARNIRIPSGATVEHDHNLIQYAPLGNGVTQNSDPFFQNTNPTDNNAFMLTIGSPATDGGDDALYLSGMGTYGDKDLAGQNRISSCAIDIGAYELQIDIKPTNKRVYVTQSGAGNRDGSSWGNACQGLATPLALAQGNCIDEIWVARGTYAPGYPVDGKSTAVRDNAFVVPEGLKIYGGFAGTETSITSRNITANSSYLSGNAHGNYHVLIAVNRLNGKPTVIDGFTIQGGNANGTSSLLVNNQIINRNEGGGAYLVTAENSNATITFINNRVTANTAAKGMGVYTRNELGTITIESNTVTANNVSTINVNGGGLYITANNGTTNIKSNTITSNMLTGSGTLGGGMYIATANGTVDIQTNTINTNTSTGNGGGVYISSTGGITNLQNNPITSNTSGGTAGNGGGVYISSAGGTTHIQNNTIASNTSSGTGGTAGNGGGIYISSIGGTITLQTNTIRDNSVRQYGGGLFISGNGSSAVVNVYRNTISENSPTVTTGTRNGGGMYISGSNNCNISVVNNLITDNTGTFTGGGMYVTNASSGKVNIVNNTIAKNAGSGNGAGFYATGTAGISLYNTIIAKNDGSNDVYAASSVAVKNNMAGSVASGTSWDESNIIADPLFADENSKNYTLQYCSPAADRGDNSYIPSGITTDFAGTTRIIGINVDMGAYESQYVCPWFTACPASSITKNVNPGTCTATNVYLEEDITASGVPVPALTYSLYNVVNGTPSSTPFKSGSGNGYDNTFPLDTTRVVVTATNIYGTATCEFDVIIKDNSLPTISCTASGKIVKTVNTAGTHYTVSGGEVDATVTKNCPDYTLKYIIDEGKATEVETTAATLNGYQFPVGVYSVKWIASDRSGNEVSCEFELVVNSGAIPVILCANNEAISGEATPGTVIRLYRNSIALNSNNPIIVAENGTWSVPFSEIPGLIVGNTITATLTENEAESAMSATKTVLTKYNCNITDGGGTTVSSVNPNIEFIFATAIPIGAAAVTYQWSIVPVNESTPVDATFKNGVNNTRTVTVNTGCRPFKLELTVTYDGCVSACEATITINNNAEAPPIITTPVCAGAATVSGTATANVPVSLYVINENVEQLVGITTANSAGNWTVPVTESISGGDIIVAKAGACETGISVTVTVFFQSTASDVTVTGETTVCYGMTATLTATAGNVTNPVFRWYASETAPTPFHTGASYTTTVLESDSTFYVTVSGSDYCEGTTAGSRKAVTVTRGEYPAVDPITGDNSVCINSEVILRNSVSGGVWSVSNSAVAEIVSSGSNSVTVRGLSSGNTYISYTVGAPCQTTVTFSLRVIPTANPAVIIGVER